MFKKASKLNLRFDTSKGLITVEDLWNLPLTSKSKTSLDSLAIAVHNELKASGETSFVDAKPAGNALLELKLDILKEVISDRKAENEAKINSESKKARNDRIKEIIADKQDEGLKGKSSEELQKMLEE